MNSASASSNISNPFRPGDRLAAYLRDSGGDTQELSTTQQENEIRAWCAERGLILARIYRDDARTGATDDRPALAQLMNDLRRGLDVSGVVIWSYSRFARNATHAQLYRAEIRKLGYIFHSLTDRIPDGAEGIIFEALIDYKNQQYLTDLSLDTRRGLRNLVQTYGCVPGTPPTGFRREPVEIGTRRDGRPRIAHRWTPDPSLAPLILRAFELRAAGVSLGKIHAELHLLGSINSYATFYSNPIYKGELRFGDLTLPNYCDPIVPPDLWARVQQIQGNYTHRRHTSAGNPLHPRRIASSFLLSGIAHCALCGAPLYGDTSVVDGKRYPAYFCSRAPRTRDCSRRRIPAPALEAAVVARLRETYLAPQTLAAIHDRVTELAAQTETARRSERKKAERDLTALRRKIRNLTDAIAETGHTRALLDHLAELERAETGLLTRLASLSDPAPVPPPLDLEQLSGRVAAALDRLFDPAHPADIQTRRLLLRALIARVDVQRDGKRISGVITLYYPPAYSPPFDANSQADTSLGEFAAISHLPPGAQRETVNRSLLFWPGARCGRPPPVLRPPSGPRSCPRGGPPPA